MNNRILIVFTFTLFTTLFSGAQDDYGILFTEDSKTANCTGFNRAFIQKPKEVSFNAIRKGDRIYLRVTDEQWLKTIMNDKLDGIAIDLISSDLYRCNATLPATQVKGTLLKPVYKSTLLSGLKKDGNSWITPVGTIPTALRSKSLEFNILFLSSNTLCQYYNIYNVKSYPWKLLDMGIYLDKIVYDSENISVENEISTDKFKTLRFTVPFEKNKSEYSALDVKPIYDSLNLTDYKISKIKINAYASVEGSVVINTKLQEDRGNSIVTALKSYLKENIETEVRTSENWAEFFQDVQNSSYADLGSLPKEEIKQKLVGTTAQNLEPILAKHRKGIVTIELLKIERFKTMSDADLIISFNEKLQAGDLENALILQKTLFDRVIKQASPDLLENMEIPQQVDYADLNNNKAIFGYYQNARQALIAKNALENVIKLAPRNKKAHYNIVAIDIFLFRNRYEGVDEKDLKSDILRLKNYGINDKLVQRMMVNLNIIRAEQNQRDKNYKEKDLAVRFIKANYKKTDFSPTDYLSLAQFLTYYDNIDSSIKLLEPVVNKVAVNEDLLYYYLNQTIVNNDLVKTDSYRAILSNAYSQNPKRFCELFKASTEDGVTFQLLHNDYLRRSYCDDCSQ